MTNKEIEKRFLFDLEMGLFKSLAHEHYGTTYNKKTYSFYSSTNLKIYNLCELLDNIGYKHKNPSIYELVPNKCISITVYPCNKRYEIGYTHKLIMNEIPEYISNYQYYLNKE